MFELQWVFITENRARRNGDTMRRGRESRHAYSIFGRPIPSWNNVFFSTAATVTVWVEVKPFFCLFLIIALFHLDHILRDVWEKPC